MKTTRSIHKVFGVLVVALACGLVVVGCSTTAKRLGSGAAAIEVGHQYSLRREAILLANRGGINSIENPDRKIEEYRPYRDYNPYYTMPLGVLPRGTVLEVQKIEVLNSKRWRFRAIGEIKSGDYKRQPLTAYAVTKGLTIGAWPRTGTVLLNNLCGGVSFDPDECVRNLEKHVD